MSLAKGGTTIYVYSKDHKLENTFSSAKKQVDFLIPVIIQLKNMPLVGNYFEKNSFYQHIKNLMKLNIMIKIIYCY